MATVERSEIYELAGDISGHLERVKKAFDRAFSLAPDQESKKKTLDVAIKAIQELRSYYRSQTVGVFIMGESLADHMEDSFSRLVRHFSEEKNGLI